MHFQIGSCVDGLNKYFVCLLCNNVKTSILSSITWVHLVTAPAQAFGWSLDPMDVHSERIIYHYLLKMELERTERRNWRDNAIRAGEAAQVLP